MEGDFHRQRLARRFGLETLIPDEPDRARVHDIIYQELCQGLIRPESRLAILSVIERLRLAGADSVILGCTEITLLIGQPDLDLPVFDTTAIHAAAGVDFILGDDGLAGRGG